MTRVAPLERLSLSFLQLACRFSWLRFISEFVMFSTVCGECFNDIPVTHGQCPFCNVTANEQKRLFVKDDGTEALWTYNQENYPFPHELLKRRKISAVLSLLFGTALSSLIIVYSYSTTSDAHIVPHSWTRGSTAVEMKEQEGQWSYDSEEILKEAATDRSRQRTTR